MPNIPVEYYNQTNPSGQEIKSRWWLTKEKDAFTHVFGVVKRINENQSSRSYENIKYARLYQNMDLMSLQPGIYSRTAPPENYITNRITLNVVKSCIDTAASKIAKNKPRPTFLTTDGNFTMQQRAKQLTQYLDGLFDSIRVYEAAQKAFIAGCVFGDGVLHFYKDDGKVGCEHVLIDELTVDDTEGMYGSPRQLHRTKFISRDVLCEMFPDSKDLISQISPLNQTTQTASDMIKVIESYHLPSGTHARDGRHSICVENCTLLWEPYNKKYFPYLHWKWSPKLVGFFGQGLAEELAGIQLEINKILRNIQIAQHLMAVPRIFVENSSAVVTAHLNNDIGAVVKYTGAPPQFGVAPAMSAEVYNHLENLYRKAFEICGISQLSATAKKPAGITAGVALRELNDLESERFMIVSQRWEQFFLDAANICIDITEDLFEEDRSLAVVANNSKFIAKIAWKEVRMDADKYVMRVYPSALLPTQPAGRLQTVQELMQAGFLGKDEALSLLDFPDTPQAMSLATASRDNILKMIDLMLNKNEYSPPEPFMDLAQAVQITQQSYLRARNDNAPDDRLELLRRFMQQCKGMLDDAKNAAMLAQQQAMQPTAAPAALAPSELMPVAEQPQPEIMGV